MHIRCDVTISSEGSHVVFAHCQFNKGGGVKDLNKLTKDGHEVK
jgi:hypothetical protein